MRKTKPMAFPSLILILDYTGIIDLPGPHWGKLAKLIMISTGLSSYSEEHTCNSFYPELGITALTSGFLTSSSIRIICRIWQPPSQTHNKQANKQTNKNQNVFLCPTPNFWFSRFAHLISSQVILMLLSRDILWESALEEVALPAYLVINNKAAIGCFCRWSWLANCLPPKLSSFLFHC